MPTGLVDRNQAQTPAPRQRVDQAIDTTVDIVTPENISFKYQVAGPHRRLGAFLIDVGIMVGGLLLLGMVGALLFALLRTTLTPLIGQEATEQIMRLLLPVASALYLVLWFGIHWFYGGIFETYWNGQTPGKRSLGIRTLTTDGEPINGLQAVLRNILRAVDAFPLLSPAIFAGTFVEEPFVQGGTMASLEATSNRLIIPTFMVGFLSMALTSRFQRIGDLVCSTMVVLEERGWLLGVTRLQDPRTPELAALIPPQFQVSRSLAAALASYVERRHLFSVARRREIARHLGEPLLQRFGMPADTSHDLLLCALYYRTFVVKSAE